MGYTTPQTTQSSSTSTKTTWASTSTTVEQTDDTPEDMTTLWIIIGVVGGVVLIVVFGIVFITMKRRNGGLFGYRNMPGFMTSGLSNPNYDNQDGEISMKEMTTRNTQ